MHTYTHTHMYTHTYVHTHTLNALICTHTHTYVHTHTKCKRTHICSHTHTHMYTNTHRHKRTHTYVHTHAHTHTYTHTHTRHTRPICFGVCKTFELPFSFLDRPRHHFHSPLLMQVTSSSWLTTSTTWLPSLGRALTATSEPPATTVLP